MSPPGFYPTCILQNALSNEDVRLFALSKRMTEMGMFGSARIFANSCLHETINQSGEVTAEQNVVYKYLPRTPSFYPPLSILQKVFSKTKFDGDMVISKFCVCAIFFRPKHDESHHMFFADFPLLLKNATAVLKCLHRAGLSHFK